MLLATYDSDEEGFLCQLCLKQHNDTLVYDPWEIVKHLRDPHKIELNKTERMKRIVGWNDKFEKSYVKNKNKKQHNPPPIFPIEKKSRKQEEKERKRRLMEEKARKEALS